MARYLGRSKYLKDIVESTDVAAGGTTIEISGDCTIEVLEGTVYLKEVDGVSKQNGALINEKIELYVNDKIVLTSSDGDGKIQIFVWELY